MASEKRIPDEIFEELSGFTTNEGKLETQITQEEFDKKYSLKNINRFRIQNAAEAFMSKSLSKIFKFFQKDSIGKNFLKDYKKNKRKTLKLSNRSSAKTKKKKFNIFRKITRWFRKIVRFIKRKIGKTFNRLKSIFKNLPKRIQSFFRNIKKFLQKRLIQLSNTIRKTFVNGLKRATRVMKTLIAGGKKRRG